MDDSANKQDDSSSENSESFSRREQDVIEKQNEGKLRSAGRPGGVSSLSQMEQDVISKTQGRRVSHATEPGVVAVGDVTSASSSKQDFHTKKQSFPSYSSSSPRDHIVASPGSAVGGSGSASLSQIERDVIAKTQRVGGAAATSPGVVFAAGGNDGGGNGISSLSNLEHDVTNKTRGRAPASSPGAIAVGSSSAQSLSRMEQDVAAKRHGRGDAPATQPGAVAALSEMERDVIEKTQGRTAGNSSSATSIENGATSSLASMEQDVRAKAQGRGSTPVAPGAVAAGGGTLSSLSRMERDVIAKAQGRTGPTEALSGGASHSLSNMEQDIVSKSQARGSTSRATTAGAMAVTGAGALSRMEQDIIAKTQGMGAEPTAIGSSSRATTGGAMAVTGAGALSRMEQDIIAKTQAMVTEPAVIGSTSHATTAGAMAVTGAGAGALSRMEQDIIAKTQGVGAEPGPSADSVAANGVASLFQMEADFVAKSQAFSGGGVPDTAADLSPPDGTSQVTYQTASWQGPEHGLMDQSPTPRHHDPSDIAIGIPESNHISDHVDEAQAPESAPVSWSGTSYGDEYTEHAVEEEQQQIQAFVADPEVVDATEVAVIASEDEEEEMERKSHRKLFIGGICFVVMLVIVVVVIASVVSGGRGGTPTTPAPSEAPSASPSMQPTASKFPQTAQCLSSITDLADFEDRETPQFKALQWITNDAYVENENLSCTDERFIVRYIFASLYFAMNGDNWQTCGRFDPDCVRSQQKGWLTSTADVCDWFQLRCSGDIVTGLDLEKPVTWKDPEPWQMPRELIYLKNITRWRMVQMKIGGSVEGIFDAWGELQKLELASNEIQGALPALSGTRHPDLRELLLRDNQFSDEIPSNYSSLISLRRLDLSSNKLAGPTPDLVFSMADLFFIDLSANSALTGALPAAIGNMERIDEIRLEETGIGGPLPQELYSVITLRILVLKGSDFSGPISTDLQNLQKLKIIDLQNNQFSGRIPNIWSNIPDLERLRLDGNPGLAGEITQEDCAAKGTGVGEIQVLFVDCNISCFDNCCNKDPSCP